MDYSSFLLVSHSFENIIDQIGQLTTYLHNNDTQTIFFLKFNKLQLSTFVLMIKHLFRDVMQGYESTVFAYGQTGTVGIISCHSNLNMNFPKLFISNQMFDSLFVGKNIYNGRRSFHT